MAKIVIETDLTLEGTKLSVDGKDITTEESVVRIGLNACSPYKSEMMGDTYKGNIYVDYTLVSNSGILENHSYGGFGDHYKGEIGKPEMEEMMSDSLKIKTADQVIRFVGKSIPVEKEKLVNKIVKYCEDNKIVCPSKDVLSIRSEESLKDKIQDLCIKLED